MRNLFGVGAMLFLTIVGGCGEEEGQKDQMVIAVPKGHELRVSAGSTGRITWTSATVKPADVFNEGATVEAVYHTATQLLVVTQVIFKGKQARKDNPTLAGSKESRYYYVQPAGWEVRPVK